MKNTKKETKKESTLEKAYRRSKMLGILAMSTAIVVATIVTWNVIRGEQTVTCTEWLQEEALPYSENEKVISAISLSYLVYGLETAQNPHGTVEQILEHEEMGIIIENADIRRTDKNDPTTAVIDSAAFIRQAVGKYRLLLSERDSQSSFYGAALADDKEKVIWIAYSGSVDFTDAMQSMMLAVGASFSRQERLAFALYEKTLQTPEIREDGYKLVLTGHSLGGALATMVSRMSNAEAVAISGACGLALNKINGIAGKKLSHYNVSNYLTSPDNGRVSFKDLVQRMMFLGDYDAVENHLYWENGMVENAHCPFGFIVFEDGDLTKPRLPK